MDNTRDVRRHGTSRFLFSHPSSKRQIKLLSGGVVDNGFSDNSKREKLAKLKKIEQVRESSRIQEKDSEMGYLGSDVEDELRLQKPSSSTIRSKNSKRPKKLFDECNNVDHASVPRKLRTAMKKRNSESVSPTLPDSRKLNDRLNGVELWAKQCTKKTKFSAKKGSSDCNLRQETSGSITKDEEEVAEALYALAGMFSENAARYKKTSNIELSVSRPSLPEAEESSKSFYEGAMGDLKSHNSSMSVSEPTNIPSDVKGMSEATAEGRSSSQPIGVEQPKLSSVKQILIVAEGPDSQINHQTMSLWPNGQVAPERPPCKSNNIGLPSELGFESGSIVMLKQSKQQEQVLSPEGQATAALNLGPTVGRQEEQQCSTKENKGAAPWPGLFSTVLQGTATQVLSSNGYSRPPAAKTPVWLEGANSCGRPKSFESAVPIEKVPKTETFRRQSWKRGASHVHISHLIKVLQGSEGENNPRVQCDLLRPNVGSRQGANMAPGNQNKMGNGLNIVVSTHNRHDHGDEKPMDGTFLHPRLDQLHMPTAFGRHNSSKQSFDFLSLFTGGNGLKTSAGSSRLGDSLGPGSQHCVPSTSSTAPRDSFLPPFCLPGTCHSSTFPDQLSAAAAEQQQLQLPPYLSNMFSGPSQLGHRTLTRQLQQQQQHPQIWAAQLASQYRTNAITTSLVQNWQNGRLDTPAPISSSQTIIPPLSLDALGPKYLSISPQQQQFLAISTSLPSARVKRQHQHLPPPLGYVENGCSLVQPLQLLCNEHL